ncbi:hypothetical protein [Streptomyces sp.]|uniref:hypothetical protein n=1 Tax=Streptomyces sp. TaxID=1931 RepID=UPI002F92EBEB
MRKSIGRPVAAIVYESDLPEVRLSGSSLSTGDGPEACTARPWDNPNWLYNHALGALALYHRLKADQARAEAEAERIKAEDARRAPWRTWLDERTEANDVSWVAIDDVARALVDAGVQVPEGGAR